MPFERWSQLKCEYCGYYEIRYVDKSDYPYGKMISWCPTCHESIDSRLVPKNELQINQ